jgi:hypothetical protein
MIQPEVAAKCGDVSGHLCLVFDRNAAAKCGYIACHLAANPDAAGKTGQLTYLLVRCDINAVAKLRVAGVVLGERRA